MTRQPAVLTLRNDDEIMRALDVLGVTEGNRSAMIKAAILHLAATRRQLEEPAALHRIKADLADLDRRLSIFLGMAA